MNFFAEYHSVQKILKTQHQVVVYSESRHYHQYFESLLLDIAENSSLRILYITSDKNDPLLTVSLQKMQVVYIKQFLGFLFAKIKAGTMIMTMPDLNNFLYKRSPQVQKYIYLFHAAVSTHLQYKEKAFFYYDTIFCTGSYQQIELRETEKRYGLPEKKLIPYGYPLLESIKKKYSLQILQAPGEQLNILIAPSWFEYCIFETCIESLVQELSKLQHHIYIRSHPEYIKRLPKKYKALQEMVSGFQNVYFDESPDVIDSLVSADILITDRSGIALEYAFGTSRPVLFIDTPLKISNPHWKKIAIEPIEITSRAAMGISVLPTNFSTIAGTLKQLINNKEIFAKNIQQLEKATFFNSAQSYRQGLDYIQSIIK